MEVGVWSIDSGRPVRAVESTVALEADLESWIEQDPSLIAQGLRIIGRQVITEAGRLDLLAIDPRGRLIVVEIKAGRLHREVIAQALDYASVVATLPADRLSAIAKEYAAKSGRHDGDDLDVVKRLSEDLDDSRREVAVIVVGAGVDPSLERLSGYLSDEFGVPIRAVSFQVMVGSGEQLLVREITETPEPEQATPTAHASISDVVGKAEAAGLGSAVRTLLAAAEKGGLHVRAYKHSLMVTPPSNKTRMLFTAWTQGGREQGLYVSPAAFAEFFDIGDQALAALGDEGYRPFTQESATQLASAIGNALKPESKLT